MDKAQKLIQGTSSALQTVVGKPSFAAAGLTIEKVQPLGAAVLSKTTELVKFGVEEAGQYASDHPYMTAAIIGGAVVALAPQLVTVPALNAAGFSTQGVVGNSLAAAAHSSIANVATGSVFSTLQSAGAGGAGAALVNGAASLAGSGVAAAAARGKHVWSKAGRAKL